MFIVSSVISKCVKFNYKGYEISVSFPRENTLMNDCRVYKGDDDITNKFKDIDLFHVDLIKLIAVKERIDSFEK